MSLDPSLKFIFDVFICRDLREKNLNIYPKTKKIKSKLSLFFWSVYNENRIFLYIFFSKDW